MTDGYYLMHQITGITQYFPPPVHTKHALTPRAVMFQLTAVNLQIRLWPDFLPQIRPKSGRSHLWTGAAFGRICGGKSGSGQIQKTEIRYTSTSFYVVTTLSKLFIYIHTHI